MKVREAGLTWSVSSQVVPHIPAAVADQALEQLLCSPRLPEALRRLQVAARRGEEAPLFLRCRHRAAESRVHQRRDHRAFTCQIPTQSSQLPPGHFTDRVCPAPRPRFCRARKTSVTLTRNDYEPDISFFGSEKAKGFTPSQSKFPAPDLIVEVLSDSTEAETAGSSSRITRRTVSANIGSWTPTRGPSSSISCRKASTGWR